MANLNLVPVRLLRFEDVAGSAPRPEDLTAFVRRFRRSDMIAIAVRFGLRLRTWDDEAHRERQIEILRTVFADDFPKVQAAFDREPVGGVAISRVAILQFFREVFQHAAEDQPEMQSIRDLVELGYALLMCHDLLRLPLSSDDSMSRAALGVPVTEYMPDTRYWQSAARTLVMLQLATSDPLQLHCDAHDLLRIFEKDMLMTPTEFVALVYGMSAHGAEIDQSLESAMHGPLALTAEWFGPDEDGKVEGRALSGIVERRLRFLPLGVQQE
jgi:hypothetical protein